MGRIKINDKDKKKDFSISMNKILNNILENFLVQKNINKSKYIESLVKRDMIERGEKLEDNF